MHSLYRSESNMSGRPVQKKANIDQLKVIAEHKSLFIETQPIIALIMRASGCTFQEIADVFGVSRQQAMTITENAQSKI